MRDLIALLDALGLERVDLAGHDWGGFTSLLLAARHPERFRTVVAISTRIRGSRSRPRLALETWRAWYAVLFAAGLMERTARLAELVHPPRGRARAPRSYVARLREPARASATTRLYRSYLRTLAHDGARRAAGAAPDRRRALLMIGEQDRAVGAIAGLDARRRGHAPRSCRAPGTSSATRTRNVVADRVRSHLR